MLFLELDTEFKESKTDTPLPNAQLLMQHPVLLRLPEVSKGLRGFLGPLIFVCEKDVDQSSNEPSAR